MNLSQVLQLASEWRAQAESLHRWGASQQAEVLERTADELERRVQEWKREALTPAEAAKESGYTADHIRRLLSNGTLPNVGDETSPQVQRQNLPYKSAPRDGGSSRGKQVASRSRVARTVIESE